MTPAALPTPAQVRTLPRTEGRTVTEADIDLNGHMNAAVIFAAQTSAMRAALADVGIDAAYVAERRMGTFAAEHHLRYLAELRLGDEFSARVRFRDRSAKAIRAQVHLLDETCEQLACVLEVICIHVDQETRRATAIPDDVAQAVDARITASEALDWQIEPRLTFRR